MTEALGMGSSRNKNKLSQVLHESITGKAIVILLRKYNYWLYYWR